MAHGGARDGAGRKPKFEGRPDTKNKRVPRDVPNHLIDEWLNIVVTLKDAGYAVDSMSVSEIVKTYLSL